MLTGKVVVITGAGSGLGREMAKAFCSRQAKVIGLGRSKEKLQQTADAIADGEFQSYSVDVGDAQQVSEAFADIIAKQGRIDILFNNAAVYPKINFLEETANQWSDALATNVSGVANCCKAVLPSMLQHNFGRIFNLGSWAHLGPIADSALYSCAKGAVHVLTKAIAVDLADHHPDTDVEIHEWIPGHLNTQMSDYTGMDPAIAAGWAVDIATKPPAPKKTSIYEQNWEWQPPKSLKQRILSTLCFGRT